ELYKEKLVYFVGSTKHNLADELRTKGYDIVILNFPADKFVEHSFHFPLFHHAINIYRDGGTDYIQRNAFILVELLKNKINPELAANGSPYQNVVIGPSMGGLITRYALKYMENQGWSHNTRLWVSFDAPHHGANIPFAMQEMLRYFKDELGNAEAGKFVDQQIYRPAARQMLICQTTSDKAKLPDYINN